MNIQAMKEAGAVFWTAIWIVVFCLGLAVVAIASIATDYYVDTHGKTCAWCYEKFLEEGWQLNDWWFCDRCWSELDLKAQEKFGNKVCAERMDYIRMLVRDRDRALEEHMRQHGNDNGPVKNKGAKHEKKVLLDS